MAKILLTITIKKEKNKGDLDMLPTTKDIVGYANNFYYVAKEENVSIEVREKAKTISLLLFELSELLIKERKESLKKCFEEKENP